MIADIGDRTKEKRSGFIISFLFVAIVTFLTENLFFAYGGGIGYYTKILLQIIFGAGAILAFLTQKSGLKISPMFLVAIFLILLSSLIYSTSTGVTVGYICIIIFAYFASRLFSFEKFIDLYQHVIFIMCVVSLLLWAMIQFVPVTHSFIPKAVLVVPSSGSINQYYTLGIANVSVDAWDLIFRNTGVFWEPGIFQAYINLSILFEFLALNKNHTVRYHRIFILIITLITTFSTTGFIGLTFLLIFQLLQGYKSSRYKGLNFILVVVLGIALVYLVFNNENVFNKIFGKLLVENRGGSFNSRYGSIVGNLRVFLHYPLIGAGFGRNTVMMQQFASDIAAGGYLDQTNTFFQYFSAFGIIVGSYFIYGWFKFSKRLTKGTFSALLVMIFMLIVTSGENFLPSAFFNLLLFYGLNKESFIKQ